MTAVEAKVIVLILDLSISKPILVNTARRKRKGNGTKNPGEGLHFLKKGSKE